MAILALLLLAQAPGRAAEPAGTDDAALLREARRAQGAGDDGKAAEIYRRLLESRPDNAALLYGYARSALAAGKAGEAADAFEKLLKATMGGDDDLRLRARAAFLAAGRTDDLPEQQPGLNYNVDVVWEGAGTARVEINDTDSGETRTRRLAINPETGLPRDDFFPRPIVSTAPEAPSREYLTGAIRLGVLYDSNVNNGTGSSRLKLGDFIELDVPSAKRKSSSGAYVGAHIEAGRGIGECGPWQAVGSASLYWRGNARPGLSDQDIREWQWGKVTAGVRHTMDRNLFDLRLKAEVFDYEFKSRVAAYGGEAAFARVVLPRLQLITRAGVEYRKFNRADERDGAYWNAGQYFRFLLGCAGHELLLGAGYRGSDADLNWFSYNGLIVSARMDFKATPKFVVSPNVSYSHDWYRGPGSALESKKRRDGQIGAGVDLEYRMSESWSLEASYQYRKNMSNSDLHDYDQHVVSAGVAWRF